MTGGEAVARWSVARPAGGAFVAALACVFAPIREAAADTRVMPELMASAYFSDNIDLDQAKREGMALELSPSLQVVQQSARLSSELRYTLRALGYSDGSDSRQVYHDAHAGADLIAVQNWVGISAGFSNTQVIADPGGRTVYGRGLFGIQNVVDASALRVAPRLDRKTSWGDVYAQYAFGKVDYDGDLFEDTEDRTLLTYASYGQPDGDLVVRGTYVTQTSEFDTFGRYRYDAALLDLARAIGGDLRVLARFGLETALLESLHGGGLDEEYWRAGVEWRPTRSDVLRFEAGERFFGSTYDASWTRTTDSARYQLSYREDPTTQSRATLELIPDGFARPVLGDARPDASREFSRNDVLPFVSKLLTADARLDGRLTTLSVVLRREHREYLGQPGRDTIIGGNVTLTRRLGPMLSASFTAMRDDWTLREGTSFLETSLSLELQRTVGRTLDVTGRFTFLDGRATDGQGYDARILMLAVRKRFGMR